MSTPRPTPETDAAWACFKGHTELLHDVKNLSRKLERERDEALSLITKTKAILQQVDLPDELLDVQAQRMVNQHDWQLGIARGQAKQIEQANRTVHTMREAIKEAHTELSNILDIINNSRGVDNWHLNGAVATWNEFDINPAVALTKLQPFIS